MCKPVKRTPNQEVALSSLWTVGAGWLFTSRWLAGRLGGKTSSVRVRLRRTSRFGGLKPDQTGCKAVCSAWLVPVPVLLVQISSGCQVLFPAVSGLRGWGYSLDRDIFASVHNTEELKNCGYCVAALPACQSFPSGLPWCCRSKITWGPEKHFYHNYLLVMEF